MDYRRLGRALLQRFLTPAMIGALLWFATEYVAFIIGGSLLGTVLFVLARPFLEGLDDFLVAHVETVRARRRAQLLEPFLRFIQAYKAVLTKYPPTLLHASGHDITSQLGTFVRYLRLVRKPRMPRGQALSAVVRDTSVTWSDFAYWELYDCQEWIDNFLAELAAGQTQALQRAVPDFLQQRGEQAWCTSLAEAEQIMDREATATLLAWPCVQRALMDPDLHQRFLTLLPLESFHRQAGLQAYLTSPRFKFPLQAVVQLIDVIRDDTVATHLLTILGNPRLVPSEPKLSRLSAPTREEERVHL